VYRFETQLLLITITRLLKSQLQFVDTTLNYSLTPSLVTYIYSIAQEQHATKPFKAKKSTIG